MRAERLELQRCAVGQRLLSLQEPAFLTDSDNNLAFLEAPGQGLCTLVACVIIGSGGAVKATGFTDFQLSCRLL